MVRRQPMATLGASGGLWCTARGSHTSGAFQSALAMPRASISRHFSCVELYGQPRRSDIVPRPTGTSPGTIVVRGPVISHTHSVWAFGFGGDSSQNLSSFHIRTVTLR